MRGGGLQISETDALPYFINSHTFLTPARQCDKVVALQQVFVYKISIATF